MSNLSTPANSTAGAAQQSTWLSDARERRNFALLQAAAVIACHPDENGESPLPEAAVALAESLLSIIESRHKEGK